MTAVDTAPAPLVETPVLAQLVLPRVNLLPPEIAERARLRRLKAGLGAGVVLTAGVVGLLALSASSDVADATARVDAVTARGAALQAQTREYADVNVVHAQAEQAQATLATAMGDEVRFSQFLDDLSTSVPEHVWLNTITFTQGTAADGTGGAAGIGTVTFTGTGFRHDDVAAWLESLAAQRGFADPYVTDSTLGRTGERTTVSFTSSVTLTADALSQRYTPKEGS